MRHIASQNIRRRSALRVTAVSVVMAVSLSAPMMLLAQTPAAAPAPAREAPRPQDVDPAVDTSRTPVDSGARTQDTAPPATGSAARKPAPSNSAAGTAAAAAPGTTVQPGGASRTQGKGKALDRLELDTTQITGNRELPKVLYIVPWKRADLGDLVGKPVNSLLDEVLTPVDRDVFKRENRYYRALTPANGATPPAGAASSSSGSASAAPQAPDEK